MKIETIYFVEMPTINTQSADELLCETEMRRLHLQFKGGLDSEKVLAWYTDKNEAKRAAELVWNSYRNFQRDVKSGKLLSGGS